MARGSRTATPSRSQSSSTTSSTTPPATTTRRRAPRSRPIAWPRWACLRRPPPRSRAASSPPGTARRANRSTPRASPCCSTWICPSSAPPPPYIAPTPRPSGASTRLSRPRPTGRHGGPCWKASSSATASTAPTACAHCGNPPHESTLPPSSPNSLEPVPPDLRHEDQQPRLLGFQDNAQGPSAPAVLRRIDAPEGGLEPRLIGIHRFVRARLRQGRQQPVELAQGRNHGGGARRQRRDHSGIAAVLTAKR